LKIKKLIYYLIKSLTLKIKYFIFEIKLNNYKFQNYFNKSNFYFKDNKILIIFNFKYFFIIFIYFNIILIIFLKSFFNNYLFI